ncbi:MAG: hypothetical protein LUE29_08070 [Lachnospiraceae bacterium]|nr:hypothetical protein [Lachnospiraceae bacterium]
MERYWQHIVNSTERRVEDFLAGQVRDTSRQDFGRLESEMIEGKPTVYLLTDCLCLYFCEQSRYFKNQELFCAVQNGVSFVERWQREDGSFDFPSCNFYSAPDTAFCFRRLYGAWELLNQYGETENEKELRERYLRLMVNCAPILLHGGFHTPNHRWAVMSALLVLAELMESEENEALTPKQLRTRAAQYLNEGIDCDEDGEYAERSTGNYNAVVDKCLMQAFEITGNESFAACVERNLSAMLYYIDGDGTVFTENSTRQDRGRRLYPDGYFYLYTWMAEKTCLDIFDAAAHKIIRDNMQQGDLAPDCMYIFMTHDRMRRHQFRGCGYPKEYRKFFRGSEVLRVQKGNFGYSVRNHKAKFLFVKFRSLSLWMRIGEAYCDIRNFIPSRMEIEDGDNRSRIGDGDTLGRIWDGEFQREIENVKPRMKIGSGEFQREIENGEPRMKIGKGHDICELETTAEGWYYAPFEEKPDTADWWKMDHTKRKRIITSRLTTKVAIRELSDGLEITVKTEGLSGLPLRVEIGIPAGCVLEHDAFRQTAQAGQSLMLKQGTLRIADGRTRVEIGPGFGAHAFGGHYSGEAGNQDGFSVFMNDYTPCERTLRIRRV